MSQENVEVVLRSLDLWNKGDLGSWPRYFDAHVVVDAPEGWPEGSVSEGLDAWTQQAQRLRETWEEARVEVDEIRPAGKDRIVARIRYVTAGKEPGMSFETPMAVAFSFGEGK